MTSIRLLVFTLSAILFTGCVLPEFDEWDLPHDEDGDGWIWKADCDDTDPTRNPGVPEICDGIDNNCNDQIDEYARDAATWFRDMDSDGYGDPHYYLLACEQPDAYVEDNTDCDDTKPAVNPGADEVCDTEDNNCDGVVDLDAVDASPYYRDADEDGFGDADHALLACAGVTGLVEDDTDCDDLDADTWPGAVEVCDGADNDCDGTVDDDAVDVGTWYIDADTDGHGDPLVSVLQCEEPIGYVYYGDDCDDADARVHPGAVEWCNGRDDDCDGSDDEDAADAPAWHPDADLDGFGDGSLPLEACDAPQDHIEDSTDCDDADPMAYPGAPEWCDGADNDCDGSLDNDAVDATDWYPDQDLDGFGDMDLPQTACDAPADHIEDGSDCDDQDPAVFPGAAEGCDGIDNDCDGSIEAYCQVTAGDDHYCALTPDGTVDCWGDELCGAQPGAGPFDQLSASSEAVCALAADGTLECWGCGILGAMPVPEGTFVQVDAGADHACALALDGTAQCWGNNVGGKATPPPDTFSAVTTGGTHSCAITDGSQELICWGADQFGQATPPSGVFLELDAGHLHSCAIGVTSAVECWGSDAHDQIYPPAGSFSQVAGGNFHSCGLRPTGVPECWGCGIDEGQCDAPQEVYSQLATGSNFTCGVLTNGDVECWGEVPQS